MAESIFKIKVSNGLINIELEGKSEIVIEQFNEIRRAGLENFLTGSPIAAKAKTVAIQETAKPEIAVVEKKKRGRKPKVAQPEEIKNDTTPAVEEKKVKRERVKKAAKPLPEAKAEPLPAAKPERKKRTKKEVVASEPAAEVAPVEIVKEAPLPKTKKLVTPKPPKEKKAKTVASVEPKVVKEKVAKTKEPKKPKVVEPKPAKIAKVKEPKTSRKRASKKEEQAPVEVNLSKMPTLEEVCGSNRPGPEREWILTYVLYASEFGKKTITRDDIVLKYEETHRKDQSKINNLTNNISNAIKKGWIENPEDKKLYITPIGITMAYTIATRTAPVKEKKTGKVPKKQRLADAPIEAPQHEKLAETPIVALPEVETPQQVAKIAKKAKSKSVKKAKAKKKPIKKAPVKKVTPPAETPVEAPKEDTTTPTEN